MGTGTLTIYSASAGSGKTHKLTGIYLSKLFRSKTAYKKILAVTFTNKAASDMKRKILSQLNQLAHGQAEDLAASLSILTRKSPEEIGVEAKEILELILHDYSGFVVGTIDSFFQGILRAFTREIGLQRGYEIELDHSQILKRAVDETLSRAGSDIGLLTWIKEYAGERLDEGRNWNLKEDILALAEEIFREKFKLLSPEDRTKLRDRSFLKSYLDEMKSIRYGFKERLAEYASRCQGILDRHNVTDDMFLRGRRGGVPSFIYMMKAGAPGAWKQPNATVSQALANPPVWTSKSGPSPQLDEALKDGFGDLFMEAGTFYTSNFRAANTAALISSNLYILGILSDILDQVHIVTTSDNRFLLSDAGELLYLIIGNDQAPFIYEKTGNKFDHFMIDEFQDTSLIQWNNFKPLIDNSMAEGNDNLVVGDVKQAIYRWRNSDWRIFGTLLQQHPGNERILLETLDTNWRSRKNIIEFNNTLFTILPHLLDESEDLAGQNNILTGLYSDAVQKGREKINGGMVRVEFVDDTPDIKFEDLVLEKLPGMIEELQDKGYSGSDIGILVRTNSEGARVLNYMLEYQMTAGEEKKRIYNYNLISNESLLLSNAPVVNFIVNFLSSLHNPEDPLIRALLLKTWLQSTGKYEYSFSFHDLEKESDRYFPAGYREFVTAVKQMPLFESVESIIKYYRLGEYPENSAYLNSLQDYILELSGSQSADVSVFLDWWKTTGMKKSIILSDQNDTMRVMTIHKSKGLEFKAVIIPFVTWNLGHGRKSPTLWISPDRAPFNRIGLVPVKYRSDLLYSFFETDYYRETYSAVIDNLNLLYVAFTRAIDCLYACCPARSQKGSVASYLLTAISGDHRASGAGVDLSEFYDKQESVLLFGNIEENIPAATLSDDERPVSRGYFVNRDIRRLHLKLKGQDWLIRDNENNSRINYGLMMHDLFKSVLTEEDIPGAVRGLVLEGKIPDSESLEMQERILSIIRNPAVSGWFRHGLKVLNERDILTPDGAVKRPDRVIIEGDKVTIVDLKFGIDKKEYEDQVDNYRRLLLGMGYQNVEGYLWFVDKNIVRKV